MRFNRFELFFTLVAGFVAILLAINALADTTPIPPTTITVGESTRHISTANGFPVPAQAGNVSSLTIADTQLSQFWQGYYGNVTGTIVLDDSSNSTLFSWDLAAPSGEVYATNTSGVVRWSNITCVNLTGNASSPGQRINLSTLTVQYNMNRSLGMENMSHESFNNTFSTLYTGTFNVGPVKIQTADKCPQVYTYVDSAAQSSNFKEVLLQDNGSALIFTSLLENNRDGYQVGSDDLHDFQMLVAEDGSPGHEAASTYYFYVELD